MDKVELEKAQDRVRLCGRNRGDHAYLPLLKKTFKQTERIEILICTRCFIRVELEEIFNLFPISSF